MNKLREKNRGLYNFLMKIKPLLYLAPFAVGVIVFSLYPIVNVLIMSFKKNYKYLTGAYDGFGFDNYIYVLNSRDFKNAIGVTFKYVLVAIPVSMCLSIVIATLLNKNIKLRAFFQTAYFLPMVTSVTAVGLTWKYMFNYKFGVINWLLEIFHVDLGSGYIRDMVDDAVYDHPAAFRSSEHRSDVLHGSPGGRREGFAHLLPHHCPAAFTDHFPGADHQLHQCVQGVQ